MIRHLLFTILATAVFAAEAPASTCRDLFTPDSATTKPQTAHLHTNLDKYVAGMEKSSLQKAAYAALARPGQIVDLGTGSGIAARDLAVLFPTSKVIGIDLDPSMVRYAQEHYDLQNLRYALGNAEAKNFADDSLDTIFMSSTAHHLTSYGTGTFDVQHVRNSIAAAHAQLKPGGLFILRDFLIPDGPKYVVLDLPATDGSNAGTPKELSSAALFEKFARDFRSSLHPKGGVPYRKLEGAQTGWQRFKVLYRDAAEFLLRKDYRDHYDAEIKEEYTFMSQRDFESSFRAAGFRVLHSAPIYNPWIVNNRFRDKARIYSLTGVAVPFPATNYVITGEKITPDQAISLQQESVRTLKAPKYLKAKAMRDIKTGKIFDVVSRAQETTDVLPYYNRDGRLYVLSKQGFPRPILTTLRRESHLDGVHSDGYVVEPISFLGVVPQTRDFATELRRRAGIPAHALQGQTPIPGLRYFTSPGLIGECVTSVAIPIKVGTEAFEHPDENYSGFSTSGTIRSIEANQVLRSAQAGSVLDARLELAVYQLLLEGGKRIDAWIGEQIRLSDVAGHFNFASSAPEVLHPRDGRNFEEASPRDFGRYLRVREGSFTEVTADGKVIARASREYVEPTKFSQSVMSVLPVVSIGGKVYVGLERRQLPSVQLIEGSSDIVTNPAWRIPKSITNLGGAQSFITGRLHADFGLRPGRVYTLGGAYHPSPGITAETVYPVAIEVESADIISSSPLTWVALEDLVRERKSVRDAHLLVASLRLAHALGLLN